MRTTTQACLALLLALAGCKSSQNPPPQAGGHDLRLAAPAPAPSATVTDRADAAAAAPEEEAPALGDVDLALRGPDGKPTRLAPYLGARMTLVNLWATWCGPCRQELPRLSRLHEQNAARGLKVVGIALDEERAVVERFLKKVPVKYPVVFGGKGTTDKLGELPGLPATLVLTPGGKVDQVLFGALDDQTERSIVEKLKKK